jgi:hypothetical protein
MTPLNRTLEIRQGVTFGPEVFTAKDAAGTPVSLTGWTVTAQAREWPTRTLAFDLAPTVTDAAAGEISISFTDEETAELTVGRYFYDMILENADGERYGPFVDGVVVVRRGLTEE